eukprot:3601254-Rhodomonas_salina.2
MASVASLHAPSWMYKKKGPVKITVPDLTAGEEMGKLQALVNLGLLGRAWPHERLLAGLAVCKWMNRELCDLIGEVELVPTGPVRPSNVKRTLERFRKHRITLRWTEQEVQSPLDRKIWDVRLENFLKAMSTTLKTWGGSIISADEEWAATPLQIVSLQVKSNGLGRKAAAMLAEVLTECKMLKELDLSGPGNRIGEAGVALLEGMRECTALTRLDLQSNNIEGASKLLRLIGDFKALSHLDLSGNEGIECKGAKQLAAVIGSCENLTSLSMQQTGMGGEGVSTPSDVPAICYTLYRTDQGCAAARLGV